MGRTEIRRALEIAEEYYEFLLNEWSLRHG